MILHPFFGALLAGVFYTFFGCLIGFLIHLVMGVVRDDIHFDLNYIVLRIKNFVKIVLIMITVTLPISIILYFIPLSFYEFIRSEKTFALDLFYYLFAFASFDFGLKNDKI